MALVTPYITEKFIAYIGYVVTTNLTFAVWLADEYTLMAPIGGVQAMLKDTGVKAPKNLSGYYLFTDLPHGTYEVSIESELYFSEAATVDILTLPPKTPVVDILVKPMPHYPFPSNATLVRGLVVKTGPVVSADVSVTGKTIKTKTDEQGEFVLYFKGIKSELITIVITKGMNTKSVTTTIMEGKTVSLGTIPFP